MSKLQARAGTPAPQCGTGVFARQLTENGLEIGRTPEGRPQCRFKFQRRRPRPFAARGLPPLPEYGAFLAKQANIAIPFLGPNRKIWESSSSSCSEISIQWASTPTGLASGSDSCMRGKPSCYFRDSMQHSTAWNLCSTPV
jgi:hypothetical protein